MKSSRHYYHIALLSICIILAAIGYYFVIKTIWAKAASVASRKSEIISGDQKKQFAEIMVESFEGAQADISLLENFFVKKEGEVEFIEFLEQTAKNEGLEVEIDTVSIDSSKNIAINSIEYLMINFHVRGTWSGVWNFSRTIEMLPYSINLRSFALLKEGGGEVSTLPATWKGIYTIKVLKKK